MHRFQLCNMLIGVHLPHLKMSDDIFAILDRRLKKYIDLDKLDMLLKTIDLILFGSRLYSLAWVCTRAMQWLCN